MLGYCETRSVAVIPITDVHLDTNAACDLREIDTPFGLPVEPEVKMTYDGAVLSSKTWPEYSNVTELGFNTGVSLVRGKFETIRCGSKASFISF